MLVGEHPIPEREELVAVYLDCGERQYETVPQVRYRAVFSPKRWVTTQADHYPMLTIDAFTLQSVFEEGPLGEELGVRLDWSSVPARIARAIVRRLDEIPVERR